MNRQSWPFEELKNWSAIESSWSRSKLGRLTKGPWDPDSMNSPPSPPNSGNPVTMVFHIGGQQRQDRRVPQGKPTLGACHRKGGNSEKTWKGNQTTKNLSTKRYLRVQGPTKAWPQTRPFPLETQPRPKDYGAARVLNLKITRSTGNQSMG